MTEIRLDKTAIERIISQVLRDDFKMLPGKANEAATNIGRRLHSSLADPQTPSLQGSRTIRPYPANDFSDTFESRMMADKGYPGSREIWEMVYRSCKPIPAVLADAGAWSKVPLIEIERKGR